MITDLGQLPARILVVDDMATNRAVVKQVLSDNIYEIIEAGDGEEAIRLINSQQFDVVLLDIMMPGMDGFEVCRIIRSNQEHALLPIIVVTALGNPDDVVMGFDVGSTDYITKPFNSVELVARIKSAIDHKRLTDRLDDTESVLFALARMVEARDSTTGDHCNRLAHMGVVFGKALGLGYDELEALRRGGVLHDIGKLAIPDAILLKQGKLTDSEWEIMRQHTTIGAELCKPLRTMRKTVDIVHCHHEKWNGSGYPKGLQGEDIPLLARIFQIIDVYDALTSVRPYKKAFTTEQAVQILIDETEKGFWDPELISRFLEIVRNRSDDLIMMKTMEEDKSEYILQQIINSGVFNKL